MCLYAAAKYPGSQVTAVSNSKTQKKFIDEQCKQRGIKNLMVGLWRCVDACAGQGRLHTTALKWTLSRCKPWGGAFSLLCWAAGLG